MRIIVGLVIFAVASEQLPPRDRAPVAQVTGTATIAGRVIVAGSNPATPVRRARVTLSSERLTAPEITDSDVEGNYRFANLPPGAYRVTVSKPGFVTLEAGAARHAQPGPAIELGDGQSAVANVTLPRGAAVEGRIVNAAGEPVQNIIVSASRFRYTPSGRRPFAVKQARTDDLGRYRIHSLPQGDYIVEAAPDARAQMNEGFAFSGDRPPGYGVTYFPGTGQVHQARPITLTSGQEARATDFALESVPLARVSGRVIDSNGAPVKNFGFRLVPVGGLVSAAGIMLPDVAGFQFPSVPAGDYWMMASVLKDPKAVAEYAVQRITIAGQDISDVTVSTSPGAVLEGRIETEGGVPLPALGRVQVRGIEVDFELPQTRPAVPAIVPAADGTFAIRGLFGPRLIRLTGLPDDWSLKQVFVGESEITDTVTDFRGSNAPRPLRIVITNATGSVTGKVSSGGGAASAYHLVVFPEQERLWTPTSRFIRQAVPRHDGTFNVHGLLPGRYFAAAVEHLDEGAWHDPDVLRKLRAGATPFTVSEPARQTLSVRLQVLR